MDGLTDRIRRHYSGEQAPTSGPVPDIDSADLLDRVHAGARRRRERRRAAVLGAAGVATVVVAGGLAIGTYGLLSDDDGTTTALGSNSDSEAAAGSAENSEPDSADGAESGADAPGPLADEGGDPIPPGFTPRSLTAISAQTYWVLGEAPDPALVRTDDGGESFVSVRVPPLSGAGHSPGDGDGHLDPRPQVRFTDDRHGWLFADGDLYATRSGGQAWAPVDDLAEVNVTHVEVAGDAAFALAMHGSGADATWSLWRGEVGSQDQEWVQLDVALTDPADLDVTDEIVVVSDVDASDIDASDHAQSPDDAQRTAPATRVVVSDDTGASFESAATPCVAELSAGQLSAAGSALWLSCPTGMLAQVAVSADAGQTWSDIDAGDDVPPNSTLVGARDAAAALVARPGELSLVETGEDATPTGPAELGPPTFVGFTTPEVGYVIDEAGRFLGTTDGAETWQEIEID